MANYLIQRFFFTAVCTENSLQELFSPGLLHPGCLLLRYSIKAFLFVIFPFEWFGHYVFHLSPLPTKCYLKAFCPLPLADDWKNYASHQVAANRARVVCRRKACVQNTDSTTRMNMRKKFENHEFLVLDHTSRTLVDIEFLVVDRSSGFAWKH